MLTATMKLKDSSSFEGKYNKFRQRVKKQRDPFIDKDPYSQG